MIDYSRLEQPFGDELGVLIRKVIKQWQRIHQKCLDEFGLTPSQIELLAAIVHLAREKVEATQIALSQETNIDPMTTSTILRNLQKKGYITRKESLTDTRARIVELTPEGIEILLKAVERIKLLYEGLIPENFDKNSVMKKLTSIHNKLNIINEQL